MKSAIAIAETAATTEMIDAVRNRRAVRNRDATYGMILAAIRRDAIRAAMIAVTIVVTVGIAAIDACRSTSSVCEQ